MLGRPKGTARQRQVITLWVDPEDKAKLKEIAHAQDTDVSRLLREMIRRELKKHQAA